MGSEKFCARRCDGGGRCVDAIVETRVKSDVPSKMHRPPLLCRWGGNWMTLSMRGELQVMGVSRQDSWGLPMHIASLPKPTKGHGWHMIRGGTEEKTVFSLLGLPIYNSIPSTSVLDAQAELFMVVS